MFYSALVLALASAGLRASSTRRRGPDAPPPTHATLELHGDWLGPLSLRFVSRAQTFWSEGIAIALEERGTHSGSSLVVDNIDIEDNKKLDYATTGHFVRWLLENEDPSSFRAG